MATYGDFPGVRVTTEKGGISQISIGATERLVLFGQANYDSATNEVSGDNADLDVSAKEPEQINAPRVADGKFGSGSELAEGMKDALANGANITYLYGVAVPRVSVSDETQQAQTGTLDNVELVENRTDITVDDDGTDLTIEFRYDGAPEAPTNADTVYINPLTGEYAADSAPVSDFLFSYDYYDYTSAFESEGVSNVVSEDETGVFFALSDSDSVSSSLNTVVNNLRTNYQLATALTFAEPNANKLLEDAETTDENAGAYARYDPSTYDDANQSVTESYFYKFAPGREENIVKTIGGGLAGLFAGNPISDPIYNETISGYQSLEQQFSKTEADDMRDRNIIPIRSGGQLRVKGNRSTAYKENDAVGADFWTRRITDRIILIGKMIGDAILGLVNDEDNRKAAAREIRAQMRSVANDGLIKPNGSDETNWTVNVYEDPTDSDEVKIDIAFTPYGIIKRVDETITVETN